MSDSIEKTVVAENPAAPKTAAAPKAAKKTAAKKNDDSRVITVLVKKAKGENAKSKSAVRFNLLRTGITVGAAYKKGYWPADLRWDLDHEFISVK